MVWCVATPFFIGSISQGRTIRQTVLGGYFFGLSGTFTSFIILGNYGLSLQMHGRLDLMAIYVQSQNLYEAIMAVFETMPFAKAGLLLLALTMIAFYATSFDALTMVASSYSYHSLDEKQEPDRFIKLFWAVTLMLLPIALIFSENSMNNLQTVSIIAAFPISFIILLIIWSFFKDAGSYATADATLNILATRAVMFDTNGKYIRTFSESGDILKNADYRMAFAREHFTDYQSGAS